MIGLLQRVSQARVEVQNKVIAHINTGLLVFIGIEKEDNQLTSNRLLERILAYRIFPDDAGKMNLSLHDIQGDLLLVPQFTLPADTKKGNRPGFSRSAPPEMSEHLFNFFLDSAKSQHHSVQSGQFGADMKVTLTNDGPVTFWLQT
jgi:D-tyrosyl-tRNA(Tyr) deacylase